MSAEKTINFDKQDLEKFFIKHLNKIYAAKMLLLVQLPEIMKNAYFSDLKYGILDTLEDVKKQVARMDEIFEIMHASVSSENSNALESLVEDSFLDISRYAGYAELRDMSILFYLHNIESIEMASFQILEMLAVKLKDERIKQLIKLNYEDARKGRTLLLLLNAKYISTV
jgi:ferritin-like metal-binding protein YciE